MTQLPEGNRLCYPLYIAEIDEDTVVVRKDCLLMIDDQEEDEPEALQFSNFCVLEDIEIYMARIGKGPDHFRQTGVYRYSFTSPG